MRHPRYPRYRLRFRPRSSFIRPRFLRIRAALVPFLFAILIDLRNDPVPQTGTRRQHTVIRHQVPPRSRHQSQSQGTRAMVRAR